MNKLKKVLNKNSSISDANQAMYHSRRKPLRKWLVALIFVLLFGTTISIISQNLQNKKSLLSEDTTKLILKSM